MVLLAMFSEESLKNQGSHKYKTPKVRAEALPGDRTWIHSLAAVPQLYIVRALASSMAGLATFLSIMACPGEKN